MPCSWSCPQTALPVGRGTKRLGSHDLQITGHVLLLTGASDDPRHLGTIWVVNHSALSTSSIPGSAGTLTTCFPFHFSHSYKDQVSPGLEMLAWNLLGLAPCAPHAASTAAPQKNFISGIRRNVISFPASLLQQLQGAQGSIHL